MASVVEILARLKADSSQFVAEMAKANQATASLDKAATKTSSILGGKLKFGLFAAGAAAGAFDPTAGDLRQVAHFLRFGSELEQRRPDHHEAHSRRRW